jgi:hypothetical protein
MNLHRANSILLRATIAAALSIATLATPAAHAQQNAATMSSAQGSQTQNRGVAAGVDVPTQLRVYALSSDNALYVLKPSVGQYAWLGRVSTPDGGNLIGIDFRPADNSSKTLYGLTDLGNLYTIDLSSNNLGATQKVSSINPRFTGGFGGLVDFNPVLNALRIAGSNDQNIAVVNGADGGNLNTTVAQTAFSYAQGDVNAGKDPEIVGGAYTNNYVGAVNTLFFLIDHDLDTLVTISGKNAGGSSNTGAGLLQTVGPLVDQNGNRVNVSPTTDIDIYTDTNGKNFLVGQTSRQLFSIDLEQVNPDLQLGRTQRVVMKRGRSVWQIGGIAAITGGTIDIAIPTRR